MKKFKFPIKAQLVTYDGTGEEIKKRKTLNCWFACNEPKQCFEVTLTEDDAEVHQSVYIDFKSLMKDVERYEKNK